MKRLYALIIGLCLALPLWAWNAPGHCVVALIAYDQLTPATKTKLEVLIQALPPTPGHTNDLCAAANWADNIRDQQINAFASWHYIDQPLRLSSKPKRYRRVPSPNVVWAISQAEAVLVSPNAQAYQQAWFLRFLLHFVGDIHQPLHTVSLFSQQFPRGDQGGNLYLINSPLADNLHSLWDEGVGLVPDGMSSKQVHALVKQLQQRYPSSYFGLQTKILAPQSWAEEGFAIAQANVYQVPYGGAPSQAYIIQGQQIAGQRLALAGYRLGYLLNLWAASTLTV